VDVDGSRLIEVTAPGTELVAPSGVTFAFCPACMEAIEASGTLTVTSTAPVPTLSPTLVAPFARLTEPAVPAMEAFSVAELRSVWAPVSASCALVTTACSDTTGEALD
jgi:hypothetical protein